MSSVLQKALSRHRAYARRVDTMLTATEHLCDGVTAALAEIDAGIHPHVREDENTQGYDGFESYMAPCLIAEWELDGYSGEAPLKLLVRLTTSFDNLYQETVVLTHTSETTGAKTLSVRIELCPDFDAQDTANVMETALARVTEQRDAFVALGGR